MAIANQGKKVFKYLLGQRIPSSKDNAAKIRVRRLEMDKNLLMYFTEFSFVYAHDPLKCKTGDTVLIQELEEKMSRLITHKVVEIIYPLGDITDPVTGKKVVVGKYRDEVKAVNQMYGESKNAFNYDKLPPRGIQEGKRDHSHKKGMVRWNADPKYTPPHAI